jgi:hypothetical protein
LSADRFPAALAHRSDSRGSRPFLSPKPAEQQSCGLAATRLAATPILTGIAAVIGVLLFNYAGSVLLVTGTAAPSGSAVSIPSLASIFSLSHNPMGLVVAAIFGFALGLVLKQLKALSDGYEKQIQNLSPSNGS